MRDCGGDPPAGCGYRGEDEALQTQRAGPTGVSLIVRDENHPAYQDAGGARPRYPLQPCEADRSRLPRGDGARRGKAPSEQSVPMAIRVRLMTLCPSLASMRLILRFFPSARTSSSVVASPWVPTTLTCWARTLPSDSQNPSVSFASVSRLGAACHQRAVCLFDPVPGMGEAVC